MARNPQIVVEYVAKTAALKQGIDDAGKQTDGFKNKLKGLAKGGALAAGAAGIGALTAGLKIGIDEFKESQQVTAQTNAVLKSTGKAAGVTAKQVDDLATSLMKKSGIDDEAIKSGENLLLTFTNVRNEAGKGNDIFNQATATMTDMSVALGQDMKSSATQLGKALNDPIKGITALSRVGVTFTEGQKKQIKALTESGDRMGAQKIILKELNKEFGGSAAAAGKTLPGQLNILKESFSNLAGELVGKLVPVLQKAIGWLRDHWPQISAAFNSFWASVKPILEGLWSLLREVALLVVKAWPAIEPVLVSLGKTVQSMAKIIATALKLISNLIKGDWKAAWENLKTIVRTAIDAVKERLRAAVAAIKAIAKALGKAIFDGIKSGITGVVQWVRDRIADVRGAIANAVSNMYNAAKNLGGKILSGILNGMSGLVADVRSRVGNAVGAVGDWINNAYNKAKSIGTSIYRGVVDGISGLVEKVRGMVSSVIGAVKGALRGFSIGPIKVLGKTVVPRIQPFAALAAGGIVTKPTLAMVGEAGPEAVVPLTGGGSNAPIEVRVFIGDTELKGLVRSEIVDSNTGLARSLLAGARTRAA